jgi:Transcription activator MBF2
METFDSYKFDDTRDFHLELKFPQQNFYITHISCLVEQASSIGKAYIIDGGIGKDYMTLVFEAKRTTYFYYRIYVFGRNYQNDAKL